MSARTGKLGFSTFGLLALAALTLTTGDAQAATTLPRVPPELSAPLSSLAIRPSTIIYTGDGTGILVGARPSASIHWTSWTSTSAVGTGDDRIDTCQHSCAGGPFRLYPVRIEAWRPATVHRQLTFTRLTRWYTGRRPANAPAHYTFSDIYQDGGWGFSPPGDDGYCTHTAGQPRAAGCANITSLP